MESMPRGVLGEAPPEGASRGAEDLGGGARTPQRTRSAALLHAPPQDAHGERGGPQGRGPLERLARARRAPRGGGP
eukprot:5040022-Pyramimonas_sp.AAC.1